MRRVAISILTVLALASAGLLAGAPAGAAPTGVTAAAAAADSGTSAAHTIATYATFSLMIGQDARVYGTGANDLGQLTGTEASKDTLTELTGLPDDVTPTGLAAGARDSLVLGSDGKVYGAGANGNYQLTDTGTTTADKTTLTELAGLPTGVTATDIAAGASYSLVLGSDGQVYGAGANNHGQVTGTTNPVKTLTRLTGLPVDVSATDISTSDYHSLVVGSNGRVYGAGWNYHSELTGPATDVGVTTLTELGGLPADVQATAVAAGRYYSLVLGSDGKIYGAGSNNVGQLTGTDTAFKTMLTALADLPDGAHATAIAAGESLTLVLGSNGHVYYTGRLPGTGSVTVLTELPGLPAGVSAIAVSGITGQALARGSDGLVYGLGTDNRLTPLALQVDAVTDSTITGTARYGDTLSISRATWADSAATPKPAWVSTTWLADGVAIGDDFGATYLLPMSLVGTRITVQEIGRYPGAVPGVVTSAPTDPVAKAAALTWTAPTKPVVGGTPKAGKKLRVTNLNRTGFDPDATSLAYQWLRNGKAISGKTKSTYTVVKADKGKKISVRITASRPGHLDGKITTAQVRIAR